MSEFEEYSEQGKDRVVGLPCIIPVCCNISAAAKILRYNIKEKKRN